MAPGPEAVAADAPRVRVYSRSGLRSRTCCYIIRARMRSVKEIREVVVADPAPFQEVWGARERSNDPAPLAVKEVWVGDRHYVVWYNWDRAERDRADREAMVDGLEQRFERGDKGPIGNKGHRKCLETRASSVAID